MQLNDMVLISVDDHITEPADLFDRHLTGDALAAAPKFRAKSDGTNFWDYQGMKIPSVALNAVVGRPKEEYGMEPTSIDQLRAGVYNVHARIGDMDANGIAASLNFGSLPNLDGLFFCAAPDKTHVVRHVQAYNDWHMDEWCNAYPGRFIPCGIIPAWDMEATVAEIADPTMNPPGRNLRSVVTAYLPAIVAPPVRMTEPAAARAFDRLGGRP